MLQCLAFGRLLLRPGLGVATAWSAVAAATILTQYYALPLAAVQGVIYLALHRGRALRTWPAALAFAPAVAWIVWHAPRLAQYADPTLAWHPALGARDVGAMAAFTINPAGVTAALGVCLVLLAAALASRLLPAKVRDESAAEPTPTCGGSPPPGRRRRVWSCCRACCARLSHGALPDPLGAGDPAGRRADGARVAARACGLSGADRALHDGGGGLHRIRAAPRRVVYGHQQASEWLMRQGVSQVVFVWDHEATADFDLGSLERLGGFFFRREGYPLVVTALRATPASDISREALAAVRGPRPGIIWIYNRAGRNRRARCAAAN